jgi:hypothetical protein
MEEINVAREKDNQLGGGIKTSDVVLATSFHQTKEHSHRKKGLYYQQYTFRPTIFLPMAG